MMPADVPWWVVVILVPASGAFWIWFQKEFWPWARSLWNTEAALKREAEKQAAADREERFLVAYEQSAKAQEQSAKALESLAKSSNESAQALQVATQTRVLDNLTLQRVERRLDAIEDRVGTAPPVVTAPRAKERGRTEGERGE